MELREHIRKALVTALESIPLSARADVYVISLLVSDTDDDPRRPTIMVGYNTEQRVAACTPAAGQEPKWPIASDAAEARWNYAFWLQNELAMICNDAADLQGAELLKAWSKERGYWYCDEEEEDDLDEALERVGPLVTEFVQIAVSIVKELHDVGEIARLFGRPLPVLIHELEYYEEIAEQNEAANPPDLVASFTRWIRTFEVQDES